MEQSSEEDARKNKEDKIVAKSRPTAMTLVREGMTQLEFRHES